MYMHREGEYVNFLYSPLHLQVRRLLSTNIVVVKIRSGKTETHLQRTMTETQKHIEAVDRRTAI